MRHPTVFQEHPQIMSGKESFEKSSPIQVIICVQETQWFIHSIFTKMKHLIPQRIVTHETNGLYKGTLFDRCHLRLCLRR